MFFAAGYEITPLVLSSFALDGGAVFGVIPKTLWQQWLPADEHNRVELVARPLLIRGHGRCILVDCGLGDKWTEKENELFQIRHIEPLIPLVQPEEVTDIICTHLHFDHCGGLSRREPTGIHLSYPNATVHLQRSNFATAKTPTLREKASYRKENVEILDQAHLSLLEGSTELLPGIHLHSSDGHTRGLQYVEIHDPNGSVLYPSDLIPTAHHLPVHYAMGYDLDVERIMQERELLLTHAERTGATVIFCHDSAIAAARIGRDKRGYFTVRETLE